MLHAPSATVDRRICRAIRAIEVRLRAGEVGDDIQAIIPQEVFEYELGAGHEPECWLEAFDLHRPMLEELIRSKHAAGHGDYVVVRSDDLHCRPGQDAATGAQPCGDTDSLRSARRSVAVATASPTANAP